MNKTILFVLALLIVPTALAHQPRVVEGSGITQVKNPEISQAFYGELDGSPAVFEIESDAPFKLYAGITVPAIEGAEKDKSVDIEALDQKGDWKRIVFLNASSGWTPFYEEFAGDDYFQGPQARASLSAGVYRITVSSPGNRGKYALAIGEEEVFGVGDTINALILLPRLKSWFFNKSPIDAFFTKIYLFALMPVIVIIIVLAMLVWALKRYALRPKKKGAGKARTGKIKKTR